MWGCNYFPYFSWAGRFFPGGILSILLWVLIILLFVLLAIKLFRSLRSGKPGQDRDRYDSLAILKTRYAKGEISGEEFVRMKNTLWQK
jgi:putative membrane protein